MPQRTSESQRLRNAIEVRDEVLPRSGAHTVGIDETSLRRGQHYANVVHDLDAKRRLFATVGRAHRRVVDFARDLKSHGAGTDQRCGGGARPWLRDEHFGVHPKRHRAGVARNSHGRDQSCFPHLRRDT